MKTGILKFNLNDRGRDLTGAPRNYEVAKLAEIINSDYVQERVRNRDLRGYLGHWLRAKFGMNPPEAGIDKVSGKLVVLEPAFVTTYLKADAEGNVEHEAEIFDTVPGRSVRQYIADKVGGFSAAIWGMVKPGVDIAKSFHGFDYVSEPNYTFNRTYEMLFDSVGDEQGELGMEAIFDSAVREIGVALDHQQRLYASLNSDHLRALELIERLTIENNDLIGRAAAGLPLFDSAAPPAFERPERGPRAEDLIAKMNSFSTQPLAGLQMLPEAKHKVDLKETRERVRRSL